MPRPLVVGNGKLLINFDDKLQMRDLYYPHVGQLNHVGGHYCKLGVWVSGQFSWVDNNEWQRSLRYRDESLVTDVTAYCKRLGVTLSIADGVHQRDTIYFKRISVRNHFPEEREICLFFHHDFSLEETEVGDTAVYDPLLHAVYHYKRRVYILANGKTSREGMHQFSVGIKRFNHAEGTWRDAEDGILESNPIAQGSVDSTISFRLLTGPKEEQAMHYWLCVGKSFAEVKELNQYVLDNDPDRLLNRVEVYWQRWVNKEQQDFANLPAHLVSLYKKSLLFVRTQIDQHGAITAANDSDILQFNRDHYSYMWPRDGAFVAYAMSKAGYEDVVARFYQFCQDALTAEGFLLHKYNPDGSAGSSWHPYIHSGEPQLPIQEDETALVLFGLWKYYKHSRQIESCQQLYASLIRPTARFLITYLHPELHLPQPSYDLWEERRGIFTFTSSAVYAGLRAAADFANLFGDERRHERYEESAEKLKQAIIRHLYDEKAGRFIRGLYLQPDGSIVRDDTVESSLFSLYFFGVLPANDPRVVATMIAVDKALQVNTPVGGYARYQRDYYFHKTNDFLNVPGNPWIISTLWMADWEIARAQTVEELEQPLQKLIWVEKQAMSSGVLSEQLDPFTGEPVSVAPLTWSHSTYVLTVLKYVEAYHKLKEGKE